MAVQFCNKKANCFFFFEAGELPTAATNFLDPNDLNQLSKVSKLFSKVANHQFKLYTKPRKKLEQKHQVLASKSNYTYLFNFFPLCRDKFVTFDVKGKEYFYDCVKQELNNYSFVSEVPSDMSSIKINELLKHIKVQFQKVSELRIILSSSKKCAIERGRGLDEVANLTDYQSLALANRADLNSNDVKNLSKWKANILGLRKTFDIATINSISEWQAEVLVKRVDLLLSDIKFLSKWKAKVLIKRHHFTVKHSKLLSEKQAEALFNNNSLTMEEALSLSQIKADALAIFSYLKFSDVEKQSDEEILKMILDHQNKSLERMQSRFSAKRECSRDFL